MTVYAWPATWAPSAFELRILPNTRSFVGAYTPVVQVIDLLGERWQGRLDLAPSVDQDETGAREAFFDRLNGQANQIALWNFRRPTPRGTARGTMTLAANAAQGANTVSISGATNGINLLLGGSFETDANSDGLADGWTVYSAGSTGTVSYAVVAGGVVGSFRQRAASTSLGTTAGDRVGISATVLGVQGGTLYTISAYMAWAQSSSASAAIYVDWYSGGGTLLSGSTVNASIALTGTLTRYAVTGAAPIGAAYCIVYLYAHSRATAGAASLEVDAVQVEAGAAASSYAAPATWLAGDMLGIAGQLVRVMAASTASDLGVATVEVKPRMRVALSAGAAVTWNRPTCNVMLKTADGVPTTHLPGYADGCTFEFVEVP